MIAAPAWRSSRRTDAAYRIPWVDAVGRLRKLRRRKSARCAQSPPDSSSTSLEESCDTRACSYSIQVDVTGGEEDVDPSAFARMVSVGTRAIAAPRGGVFPRKARIPASRSLVHRSASQKAAALG